MNTIDEFSVKDNTLVFYSEDKEILAAYEAHFDQFWSNEFNKGRVIKSLKDFNNYIPFNKDLYDRYNSMKRYIKRIPNDSVRMKHLRKEISILHQRLEGLNNCMLSFRHSNRNQRISDCFYDYIEDLDEGKTYKTVSIYAFWDLLYSSRKYFDLQKIALLKKANIERIYFIDFTLIFDAYSKENKNNKDIITKVNQHKEIIKENYKHFKKFSNYKFLILFSESSSESVRTENFAIWTDEPNSYKVVFKMNYGFPLAFTELVFANYGPNEKDHFNKGAVDGFEKSYEIEYDRVIDQNENIYSYFLNKKFNELNVDLDLEVKIQFLKDCGIDDLEFFLTDDRF